MSFFSFEIYVNKVLDLQTELIKIPMDLMTNIYYNKLELMQCSTILLEIYQLSNKIQPKNKINYIKYAHNDLIVFEFKRDVSIKLINELNKLNSIAETEILDNYLFIYFNSCKLVSKNVS